MGLLSPLSPVSRGGGWAGNLAKQNWVLVAVQVTPPSKARDILRLSPLNLKRLNEP